MKAIFMLMVVALASPAFGQTTPPYDVTTAAGYREWARRYASALCTPSVDLDAQYLPAVDLVNNQASISFEWYQQTNDSGTRRWTMRTACSRAGHPKRIICTNTTPYEGFSQSCAQLRLPGEDAEISGLPPGWTVSGTPPFTEPPLIPHNAPYDITTAAGYREWAIAMRLLTAKTRTRMAKIAPLGSLQ